MTVAARWIRLDSEDAEALRAAGAGFALAQDARAAPAMLWSRTRNGRFAFALVVPRLRAPGRARRWNAWALAPLVATFRQFGLRAYDGGGSLCVSGRAVADCEAAEVGCCAVVGTGIPLDLRGLPAERQFIDAFRARVEAQHGWQFDHAWPADAEKVAIAGALAAEETGAG